MLEDRLRAIRFRNSKDKDGHYIPRTHLSSAEIEMVKQVFMDEGWHEPITDKNIEDIVDKMDAKQAALMSGQEWYEKYKKLSDENVHTPVPLKPGGGFDYKAFGESLARKAAGL